MAISPQRAIESKREKRAQHCKGKLSDALAEREMDAAMALVRTFIENLERLVWQLFGGSLILVPD